MLWRKGQKQSSSECDTSLGITIAGNSFSTWYKKHKEYINAVLCSVQLLEHVNTQACSVAKS